MTAQVAEVTNDNYDVEVTNSDLPVALDLWAPWCGPCHMVSPILEQLAEQYNGKFKICKLNVDESPQIAGRFGVNAIPTILFIKDGREVNRFVGVQPRDRYQMAIEALIDE